MNTKAICRIAVRAFGFWLLLVTPVFASAATHTLSTKSTSGFGQDNNATTWLMSNSTGSSQGVVYNQMTICPDQNKCATTAQVQFQIQIPFAPDDLSVTFGGLQGFDGSSYGIETCANSSSVPPNNSLPLCTPPSGGSMNADVTIPGGNGSLTLTFAPTSASPTSSYFPNGGLTFYIVESFALGSSLPPAPTVTNVSGHAGVALLPASLAFGSQTVNTTSALQSVLLKNGGVTPLSIWSIATNGDFAEIDNCRATSSLAAGASCTILVSFTPAAAGTRSGVLTIGDNAPSGPQTISLSGTGDSTLITLSSPTLAFGSQPITTASTTSSPSTTLTVTLTNTSSTNSISVTGVTVSADPVATTSGDFNVEGTSTCTNSTAVAFGTPFSGSVNVAALGTCTLAIDAQPLQLGPVSGTITVTDSSGTHVIAVSTIGATPMLTLTGSPSGPPLTFSSSQNDGTSSGPQTVALGLVSPASAAVAALLPGGGVSTDGTTTCTVGGSASCNLKLDFSPIFPGAQTNQYVFIHNAGSGIAVISTMGTGLGPAVSLSPSSLSFTPQSVGTTSSPLTLTLLNSGNQPLTISSVAISGGNSGDFQIQSDACPISSSTLAANASCTVSVTFSPTSPGPRKSSLVFTDNAPGSPHSASLAGLGVEVTLSPGSLTFAGQTSGTSSSPQTLTLTNAGSTTLNIWQITFAGTNASDYSKTTTCGATLAVSASCNINVTFTPAGVGSSSASLLISDNGGGGLQAASLSGTGLAGPISGGTTTGNASGAIGGTFTWANMISPAIQFGARSVGSAPRTLSVVLKNSSKTAIVIRGIVISGTDAPDFAQSNTCGTLAPAGGTCTLQITFTPRASGLRTATLNVISNALRGVPPLRLRGFGALQRNRPSSPPIRQKDLVSPRGP